MGKVSIDLDLLFYDEDDHLFDDDVNEDHDSDDDLPDLSDVELNTNGQTFDDLGKRY